jgi:hypothetical protein
VKGKEKYHTEVSNRFAALEDLDAEVEISSAWEGIRYNISKRVQVIVNCGIIRYGLTKDPQNY